MVAVRRSGLCPSRGDKANGVLQRAVQGGCVIQGRIPGLRQIQQTGER